VLEHELHYVLFQRSHFFMERRRPPKEHKRFGKKGPTGGQILHFTDINAMSISDRL
jgi:hypothetical protein